MTLKDDILTDLSTIYDTDDMADSATHTPRSTGIESAEFSCFIGDNVLHGDDVSEEVEDELIEMSVPTANISGIKRLDKITANSIDYEVVHVPVLDSAVSGISFITLRMPLNNQTGV